MADSDSKSIGWTNDTNTLGHRFTCAAQRAEPSGRPWAAAAPARLARPPAARRPRALPWAPRHLGPLCRQPGPKRAHSQRLPVALGTLPFNKGRLWLQQWFWQQNSSFSLKPCHRLDLERDMPPPFISFIFPIFMWSPPAFQLVTALVRLNGLAGEMTSLCPCLGPT